MKQILKYIIFIMIGIIIYSYINSYNTFSIGIPWCIVNKEAPDVILTNTDIDTLPPNGMLLSNIRPTLENLGLDASQYSAKRCNIIDSHVVLQNVSEGVPSCSVKFNKLDKTYTILEYLLTPPTIPEIDGINRINLFNTSLQDLILLRDIAMRRIFKRKQLITNIQLIIINESIQLKQILSRSENEELNRIYNSLFPGGVFDPNVVKQLTPEQINKLDQKHIVEKFSQSDIRSKSVYNLGFIYQQKILIKKREYLLNNPEFAIVYNRVINSDGSINSEAEFTDVQTVYTVSNANEQTIGGKSFLLTDTQNRVLSTFYKPNYLQENPNIRSLYYRIYNEDGPINIDAIDEMSIEELRQLKDAQYNIGRESYNLIDPSNDRVIYALIESRIFALQYRLSTNVIDESEGQANIVAMSNSEGNIEINEYSSVEGVTGTGEYGLPVINKAKLRGLNTRYYLISTELVESGIFTRSIQVTGTLVGIGGKDDVVNPYLSILAFTFQNPRYLPIDEIRDSVESSALLMTYKSEVSEIDRVFQTTVFTLPETQTMPNRLVIPEWLRV